jgi:glyoxylase-like metal-dependent hydrolase (beta-lactamase superfamily II)
MNVYLIHSADGVVVFDAGIAAMAGAVREAAAVLGGVERVVLGHAHPDHRGTAPALGAPVFCHPDDKVDAESERGEHYFDTGKLPIPARWVYPSLLRHWDGGPVEIAGTVEEGDEIAGFTVVHLPGHAPGLIGLFRESDRLALVSDLFYTVDVRTGRPCSPRLSHDAFMYDRAQARGSLLKLAELRPAVAWPGHLDAIRGDVRDQLIRIADADVGGPSPA